MSGVRPVRASTPRDDDATGPLLHRMIGVLFRFIEPGPTVILGREIITILQCFLQEQQDGVPTNPTLVRILRDAAHPFASLGLRELWNGFSELDHQERINAELQVLINDGALDRLGIAAANEPERWFVVMAGAPIIDMPEWNPRNGRDSPPGWGLLIPTSDSDMDYQTEDSEAYRGEEQRNSSETDAPVSTHGSR